MRKSNNELNIAKKENEKLFDYKMRSEKEKAQKAIKESEKNAAIETAVFTDLSRKKPQREKNDAKPTKSILDASFEKMKGDLASPIQAYKKVGFSVFRRGHCWLCNLRKMMKQTVLSIKNGEISSLHKKIIFRNLNCFLFCCNFAVAKRLPSRGMEVFSYSAKTTCGKPNFF